MFVFKSLQARRESRGIGLEIGQGEGENGCVGCCRQWLKPGIRSWNQEVGTHGPGTCSSGL